MRDYGVVSPKFWIGETGKALRGDAKAQLLALYLMTCPHSNMIGVFHCPIVYMGHETGMGIEGATEALARLCEARFCTYDTQSETVFVHTMAVFQVGESLKAEDNRVKSVTREWQNIGPAQLKSAFHAIYSVAFHLPDEDKKQRGSKAPPKPLPSQEQEQEQEHGQDQKQGKSAVAPHLASIPESLLADFLKVRKAKKGGELTATALAGIQREADKAGLTLIQAITACCEYSWVGFNAGWYAERNAPKAGKFPDKNAVPPVSAIWHESAAGVRARAAELGIEERDLEQFPIFKARVMAADRQGATA